jgi:hypothetical protein
MYYMLEKIEQKNACLGISLHKVRLRTRKLNLHVKIKYMTCFLPFFHILFNFFVLLLLLFYFFLHFGLVVRGYVYFFELLVGL